MDKRIKKQMKKNKRIFIWCIALMLCGYMMVSAVAPDAGTGMRMRQAVSAAGVEELDMGDYADSMTVGEKQLLSVTVLPVDAEETKITYSSSNVAVATVNGLGRVTALSVGSTVVSASCGGKSGSFTLTVKEKETAINITELDMGDYADSMTVGEKQMLSVAVLPVDAGDAKITYSSSDIAVATVNGFGRITALSVGSTVISAACGDKSSSFTLTVKEKEKIAVTELDMGDYSKKMEAGKTQVLSVTALPLNATETNITYASSNTKVAVINAMGRITALRTGRARITAYCDGMSASFMLKVVKEKKEAVATEIEISDYEKKLAVDKTLTLTATVLPSDAKDNKVSYRSSDTSVATVNSSGEVKGISRGNVTIYAMAGDVTKTIPITVIVPTTAIKLNNDYLVLKPGESYQLTASVFPSGAEQGITYRSSDTSVAAVTDEGMVTAKAAGSTSIIVSNGDSSAAVSVIVNQSQRKQPGISEKASVLNAGKIYDKIVATSAVSKIDSDALYNLYSEREAMEIIGDGYIIELNGKDIVNYNNEFYTDISLKEAQGGLYFNLNGGESLCGVVKLYIDNPKGSYLYLKNNAKDRYELIQEKDLSELTLTTAGEYRIVSKKIHDNAGIIRYMVIAGVLLVLIGVTVYVIICKKYWFW